MRAISMPWRVRMACRSLTSGGALLSWLAAQPGVGPRRQDSVRYEFSHDTTTDETINSIPAALDDVFAGLVVAL